MAFPADGSETTVWQYDADALGGGRRHPEQPTTRRPRSTRPRASRALTMLQQMQQDGSLYLDFHPDAGKSEDLFNSGNIGMLITGPWDLSAFPDCELRRAGHAVVRPGRQPRDDRRSRQLGDLRQRRASGSTPRGSSSKYLDSPGERARGLAGHGAPADARLGRADARVLARSTRSTRAWRRSSKNLANVTKARPQITQYPQISAALGEAIVQRPAGQGGAAAGARRRGGDRRTASWRSPRSPDGGGDAGPTGARVRPRGRVVLRVPRRLPDRALRDRPDRVVRAALVPEDQPLVPAGVDRAEELRGAHPRPDREGRRAPQRDLHRAVRPDLGGGRPAHRGGAEPEDPRREVVPHRGVRPGGGLHDRHDDHLPVGVRSALRPRELAPGEGGARSVRVLRDRRTAPCTRSWA